MFEQYFVMFLLLPSCVWRESKCEAGDGDNYYNLIELILATGLRCWLGYHSERVTEIRLIECSKASRSSINSYK